MLPTNATNHEMSLGHTCPTCRAYLAGEQDKRTREYRHTVSMEASYAQDILRQSMKEAAERAAEHGATAKGAEFAAGMAARNAENLEDPS